MKTLPVIPDYPRCGANDPVFDPHPQHGASARCKACGRFIKWIGLEAASTLFQTEAHKKAVARGAEVDAEKSSWWASVMKESEQSD
jgi:hypothetical protein